MRKLRDFAIFAFLLLALLSAGASAGPADDQYAVAAGHYKRQRWKLAAAEFQAFLAKNPGHANASKAHFYLGEALLRLRSFADAVKAYRAFLELVPEDPLAKKARFRIGEALYLAGSADEARAELQRFKNDFPDERLLSYVLPYLGDLALRAGDAAQGQQIYEEALARYPQGPLADDCHFGLARALETQGKNAAALAHFERLAAKPKSPWAGKARFRLAAIHYASGEYQQALKLFQQLVEEPGSANQAMRLRAALAAGECLYQLNQFEAAQQRFEQLLAEQSVADEARYWLGLTLLARKDWNAAAQNLLAVAGQGQGNSPRAPAARFHAGEALLQAGKVDEAHSEFDLVLKTWPKGDFAEKSLLGLMRVALASGQHQRVDELAAQFAEIYPKTSLKQEIDRVVGRSLLERNDHIAAAALFERLLAAEANDDSNRDADRCQLAAAYLGQSRYDDALKALDTIAHAGQPTGDGRQLWIDIARVRAAAWVGLNRFAEAAQLLDRLLAARPDGQTGAWARAELAVCLAKSKQLARAKEVYKQIAPDAAKGDVLAAAQLALASAAVEQDDPQWAEELLAKLTAEPSAFRARALWALARKHVKQGDLARAVSALDTLLTEYADDPLMPDASLVRGQLAERLEDDTAALAAYRRIIDAPAAARQLPQALLGAARVEQRLKHPREAAELYQRLDTQFPDLPEREAVFYQWAWALVEAGDRDKASTLFERLRAQTPHGRYWSDAVYRLAERAFEAKDYAGAEQLVSELLAGEPSPQVGPHALFLQAQVAIAQNQWARVAGPLERLAAEFGDSSLVPLARYFMAEAAYRQGQYDRASELFRELGDVLRGRNDGLAPMVPLRRAQILAHQEEWHDALEMASQIEVDFPDFEQQYEVDYVIGRCEARLAHFDEARAAYRRVLHSPTGEKTETAAKAHWMIGETFFHQKNFEAALREYLQVEILYDYPTWQAAALFEAGKCHEQLGEAKQAADLYDKLIKTYPDSPLVKDAAQRLKDNNARAQK